MARASSRRSHTLQGLLQTVGFRLAAVKFNLIFYFPLPIQKYLEH